MSIHFRRLVVVRFRGFYRGFSVEGDILDKYAKLLRECGEARDYSRGRRVHESLVKRGLFGRYLGNLLVEMYGRCGCLEEAWSVFSGITRKNVYSWNLMASALLQNGREEETIELYWGMCLLGVEIDEFTLLAVLAACTSSARMRVGNRVHESIRWSKLIRSVLVGGALLTMYGRCGRVERAREVFDEMRSRTTVSWNAMLAAYSQNELGGEALKLYHSMLLDGVGVDSVTLVTVLSSCASAGRLKEGREAQEIARSCGAEGDINVGNALITFYGKCGSAREARRVFEGMEVRNLVSWTAIISALGQSGQHREALELFKSVEHLEQLDSVIVVAALDSCSSLCELEIGRGIHRGLRRTQRDIQILKQVAVGNSLLQLYGRCGALEDAREAFEEIDQHDLQSWGLLIAAHTQSGAGEEALEIYLEMILEGIKPSSFTMTSVLDACSHLGLSCRARECFVLMGEDHQVEASVEHFGCLVDLLGRIGRLDEAQELIEEHLPHAADDIMWLILLSACRIHGDAQRGLFVASRLAALDQTASASYVLMSNSMINWEFEC